MDALTHQLEHFRPTTTTCAVCLVGEYSLFAGYTFIYYSQTAVATTQIVTGLLTAVAATYSKATYLQGAALGIAARGINELYGLYTRNKINLADMFLATLTGTVATVAVVATSIALRRRELHLP